MFFSGSGRRRSGASALTGPVTVPGTMAGAYVEGERREMSVFAPGGYHWVPGLGDEVLVLKAGEQGERPCVVGCVMGEAGLRPGEVLISAGRAAILLSPEGAVRVTGNLSVNGTSVGPPLPPLEEDGDETGGES